MIAVIVIAVVLAVACVALVVALVRARDSAQRQIDAARAEAARAAASLEAAQAELATSQGEVQAALDEAEGARAEAHARRGEAAGARAEAQAARAELADRRAEWASGGTLGAAGGSGAVASMAGEGAVGTDTSVGTAPANSALGALWSLTRIRQEWISRQAASLNLEADRPEGTWAQATLAEVLEEEVSRIREDTGTPGALRTSLPGEPPAGQSMLLLAGVQALLDALARHCQAYDLYVHHWEGRLTAMVVCEGFDGPDRVASDTEAVLSAIAPAGGELGLDRDQQGRLRARLSLPLSSPA